MTNKLYSHFSKVTSCCIVAISYFMRMQYLLKIGGLVVWTDIFKMRTVDVNTGLYTSEQAY